VLRAGIRMVGKTRILVEQQEARRLGTESGTRNPGEGLEIRPVRQGLRAPRKSGLTKDLSDRGIRGRRPLLPGEVSEPRERPAPEPAVDPGPPQLRITPPEGHILCPDRKAGLPPLLQQAVRPGLCRERQASGYHKCFQCKHRVSGSWKGRGLPPLDNGPGTFKEEARGSTPEG